MTDTSALQYLNSFLNLESISRFSYGSGLNLKRMNALLGCFGYPERSFQSILVAGTKGKGSTACFLQSVLSAHGLKTGLYTSPHLSDFRERIRIGPKLISQKEIGRLVGRIRRVIEKNRDKIKPFGAITYFEITTLLAFLYFSECQVDWAVLEVGMGGRLDATCVVRPKLSVLTPVSLDHEEYLGKTIRAIAKEKAAIIRRGIPFVSGRQVSTAKFAFEKRGRAAGAKSFFLGRDFDCNVKSLKRDGSSFYFRMKGKKPLDCQIRLPGLFQVDNASLALAGLKVLEKNGEITFSERLIQKGLRNAFWPGRFEIIKRNGRIFVLDGAHNGASTKELFKSLKRLFPGEEIAAIFAASREKKLPPIFSTIGKYSKVVLVTKADHPRAQDIRIIMESGRPFCRAIVPAENIKEAIGFLSQINNERTINLVTGSLFLVGEARDFLKAKVSYAT